MKVKVEFIVQRHDPHVDAAILDLLRQGQQPSRIRKRDVINGIKSYLHDYGCNVNEVADVDIDDPTDDEWEQMDYVKDRIVW